MLAHDRSRTAVWAARTAVRDRSTADELTRLADLKAEGVISDAGFEQAKAKAVA